MNAGNIIFIIGIILILIGFVYPLGYKESAIFKYSFYIGFIVFGLGILIESILKIRRKD